MGTTALSDHRHPNARDPLYLEIARLREENETLRSELKVMRGDTTLRPFPREWGLTPTYQAILVSLARAPSGQRSNEALLQCCSGRGEDLGKKIVQVHICRMRRLLSPHGVVIETVWGLGFRLTPRSKDMLLRFLRTAEENL